VYCCYFKSLAFFSPLTQFGCHLTTTTFGYNNIKQCCTSVWRKVSHASHCCAGECPNSSENRIFLNLWFKSLLSVLDYKEEKRSPVVQREQPYEFCCWGWFFSISISPNTIKKGRISLGLRRKSCWKSCQLEKLESSRTDQEEATDTASGSHCDMLISMSSMS
jgi:hypothetical protein